MPYALFSDATKLSKAYPTEAEVWAIARDSGLVVDVASDDPDASSQAFLDHDYRICACEPDPGECPMRNHHDANNDKDFHDSLTAIAAR